MLARFRTRRRVARRPTSHRSTIIRRDRHRQRSGLATVELAICLPLMFLLTLATIDVCSLIFLKESLTLAAYEGARQGTSEGQTDADVRARVIEFLDRRGINHADDASVSISTPGFDDAATLEHVTTTVTVPIGGNLLMPTDLFGTGNVSASVTMRKEFANR